MRMPAPALARPAECWAWAWASPIGRCRTKNGGGAHRARHKPASRPVSRWGAAMSGPGGAQRRSRRPPPLQARLRADEEDEACAAVRRSAALH
eukprot:scaffold897_cov402-Prasinococcus_capsulatus_cf.AAC.25